MKPEAFLVNVRVLADHRDIHIKLKEARNFLFWVRSLKSMLLK